MVVVDSTSSRNHIYKDGCPRYYLTHKEGYGWIGVDLLWVKPEEVSKIQSRILPGGTKVLAKI